MDKFNLLSRAEMKNVTGGSIPKEFDGYNPNCGETNPVGDYVCCTWTSIIHVGEMDCDSASTACANQGGHGITTDPSRC
ncbi:hypothetical protein [Pedobacter montanisoli]|uniref:Bacteriocin n=1 Tax=Pedobacter montanisoli TaxID=2923277 RepID=A0ABS9ZVF0_9SPHI|nr:hypothetical protein [Pedobacter montanisoli]MCJ0741479.1 hypothetical protein [Pedobacter montanisoli]